MKFVSRLLSFESKRKVFLQFMKWVRNGRIFGKKAFLGEKSIRKVEENKRKQKKSILKIFNVFKRFESIDCQEIFLKVDSREPANSKNSRYLYQ